MCYISYYTNESRIHDNPNGSVLYPLIFMFPLYTNIYISIIIYFGIYTLSQIAILNSIYDSLRIRVIIVQIRRRRTLESNPIREQLSINILFIKKNHIIVYNKLSAFVKACIY